MGYAVIESGGKQFIAREGETIDVDRMAVDIGTKVQFDQVLLTSNDGDVRVGTPTVGGAKVEGKVLDQVKGPKILVFRYKPKIRYRRRQGHRQKYTRISIEAIKFPSGKAAKAAKVEPESTAQKAAESKPKAAAAATQELDLSSMRKAELEALAEELGVMPESGSGAGGSVLVKDLRQAIEKARKK